MLALNDGKPLGCVVIARRGHNRPITRVAVPAGMQACPKFRVSAASIKVPPDRQRSGASSLSPAGYGAHAVPGDTPGPFFLPCKRRWSAGQRFFRHVRAFSVKFDPAGLRVRARLSPCGERSDGKSPEPRIMSIFLFQKPTGTLLADSQFPFVFPTEG